MLDGPIVMQWGTEFPHRLNLNSRRPRRTE
jgi:hypothetical protein